ncbi:FAD/NAD(P)-binding domain-containing protein [Massarina eburnea CBS 473.64]|uniref:FAD/NAD(P)-binding domain-containing protein n=1 Tax=Massarina eburnea CBS 473.64 TaxID=1395130 RepID=A0A6A6SC72_9PLEO|nr:FAD/NAD(P)-binding domain-containing protein [Massarina eburnea CBS 473.64]
MQKSVAIVGGGPAGLVAAKTLLHHGGGAKFKITVFEAAERVGGMWRSLPGETGVKCSPSMRTNLSRFTVAFSDLSWASVDLSEDSRTSTTLPMFPKACQVGRYLDAYAQRFLPGVIQLNTRVAAAELIGESGTWNVTYIDTLTQQESKDTFDYLIVASGFFERPTQSIRRSQDPEASTKIQHSSHFRNISSLTETPGKIVVIGGGISGSEAAATAAFQISSARHSTSTQKPAWADSTVYHIINRPFYALPRYIPQDPYNPAIQGYNPAPHFLPLDLNLYNLGRRGGGSITASNGLMPAEKAKKAHEFIRNVIGGDQRDLGKDELVYKPADTQYPAFTGISDTYAEFVRSGLIVPVRGHVANIAYHDNDDEAADRFNVEILDNGSFNEDKGVRKSCLCPSRQE